MQKEQQQPITTTYEEEIQNLTLDDMFEQAERRSSIDVISDITEELQDWYENDERSFRTGYHNLITSLKGNNFRATLLYKVDHLESESKQPIAFNLCSSSIKSLGYIIEDILPDDGEGYPKKTLRIYGHTMDYENEFDSQLDKKLTYAFASDFATKFDYVELSGCFPDVETMRDVIMTLYKRLTRQDYISKIILHLDSMVKDDDGKWRTVADLIHSGYVESSVVRIPNIVEYAFGRLDPAYTEKLYTTEYKEGSGDLLAETETES